MRFCLIIGPSKYGTKYLRMAEVKFVKKLKGYGLLKAIFFPENSQISIHQYTLIHINIQ